MFPWPQEIADDFYTTTEAGRAIVQDLEVPFEVEAAGTTAAAAAGSAVLVKSKWVGCGGGWLEAAMCACTMCVPGSCEGAHVSISYPLLRPSPPAPPGTARPRWSWCGRACGAACGSWRATSACTWGACECGTLMVEVVFEGQGEETSRHAHHTRRFTRLRAALHRVSPHSPAPRLPPCLPPCLPLAPTKRSIQTILLSFVVGTLFLQEDKGLQTTVDGAPDVAASLASANNFLGVMFFSTITFSESQGLIKGKGRGVGGLVACCRRGMGAAADPGERRDAAGACCAAEAASVPPSFCPPTGSHATKQLALFSSAPSPSPSPPAPRSRGLLPRQRHARRGAPRVVSLLLCCIVWRDAPLCTGLAAWQPGKPAHMLVAALLPVHPPRRFKHRSASFYPAYCFALQTFLMRVPWVFAETWVWTLMVVSGRAGVGGWVVAPAWPGCLRGSVGSWAVSLAALKRIARLAHPLHPSPQIFSTFASAS